MNEEIKKLIEKRKVLRRALEDTEKQIKDLQGKCPHVNVEEVPWGPVWKYNNTQDKRNFCLDCDKNLGEVCDKNPNKPRVHEFRDEDAGDFHAPCIHCGKLWEDCKW